VRFSATLLESFRLHRLDVVPEAELVATIRGEFKETPRILLGRAYDKVLEQPDAHRTRDGYACGQYRFEADVVEPALAVIDRRGLFQVKGTRKYGEHTVVSKVDHVLGAEIAEFKTRLGDYVVEKYADSVQWRFQADIFEAVSVTYRVFCLREDPIALKAIETLPLYPYRTMRAECAELVEQLARFVRRRGLEAFLPDKVELLGPAFEDSPTRPASPHTARLKRLRDELRDRRQEQASGLELWSTLRGRPLPIEPTRLPELAPVAELPEPLFTLRPPIPAGGPRQPRLF
jgi:hypothetical protein